ncbi:MAG: carbonic anhydrase [Parvularculaceae bacterium]
MEKSLGGLALGVACFAATACANTFSLLAGSPTIGQSGTGHSYAPGAAAGNREGHRQADDKVVSPPHWTYDHQEEWSATFADAAACARGSRQSPIDLKSAPFVDEPDLVPAWRAGDGRLFNNGHTVEIEVEQGSFMMLDDERFELLQAHFHDPSEHRLDGEQFAMEMHFVHRKASGALAVVGVLMRAGAENDTLARLWSAIPPSVGKEHAATVAFDPNAFLPADRVHFQYDGSLTTPPCTEGVTWLVMRSPIDASLAQVAAFRAIEGENARALQERNGRMVTEGE